MKQKDNSEAISKAIQAARLADSKKAEDVLVLDLGNVCSFTDVFVICTGQTRLQLKAIADTIHVGVKALGYPAPMTDGHRQSNWMILDFGDVVVHIMSPDARAFYQLESLWGDGIEVDWAAGDRIESLARPG